MDEREADRRVLRQAHWAETMMEAWGLEVGAIYRVTVRFSNGGSREEPRPLRYLGLGFDILRWESADNDRVLGYLGPERLVSVTRVQNGA